MSKTRRLGVTLTSFIIGSWLFVSENVEASENFSSFHHRLDQLLAAEPDLNGAIAGISIRTSTDGKIIYNHNGDTRLRPASNLKLVTAAAALSVLGESYTFTTEVLMNGKIKGSTLIGNLFLKGKGDPTLLKTDFENMAKEIRKKGIRTIKGDLIGDDCWYDDIRYSYDLPWSDETTYYGAQISALTASPTRDFDAGTVIIDVYPGDKMGEKALIKMLPKTDTLKIVNKTVTISEEGRKEISAERKHGTNEIFIKGKIPLKSRKIRERAAVWKPADYALDLFYQALRNQGIYIKGKVQTGLTDQKARLIAEHHSIPLSDLLIPFMKLSNNGHAEVLIKEMGKVKKGKGSWEKGLNVVENELPKFGLNPDNIILRDGSGVSHVDQISANQLTQLLYAIQKTTWFPVFYNALPTTGEKDKMLGGTLRYRLKNPELKGRIRAKTGSLSTVSSLSGYILTKSGKTFIFSILLNNMLDEKSGKKIEDKIAVLLADQ